MLEEDIAPLLPVAETEVFDAVPDEADAEEVGL